MTVVNWHGKYIKKRNNFEKYIRENWNLMNFLWFYEKTQKKIIKNTKNFIIIFIKDIEKLYAIDYFKNYSLKVYFYKYLLLSKTK